MKRILVSLSIVIVVIVISCNSWAANYAISKKATPVFNVSDIKNIYKIDTKRRKQLQDNCFHMKELEFIALPNTVFQITGTVNKNGLEILKIETSDYPYPSKTGYYIDSRFVEKFDSKPVKKKRGLPSRKEIIKRMKESLGERYTWGGNYHNGLSDLPNDYVLAKNKVIMDRLLFKGVDCSGLLYEATNAHTPRNTSGLVKFGKSVKIAGKDIDQIIKKVKPLDIIVWRGHVMIVLDKEKIIESRADYDKDMPGCQGGVRIRSLESVLEEVLETRIAVNDYDDSVPEGKKKFVIRRWFKR